MSSKPQIARRCKDCPDWTHTVCCFLFGKFWRDKSQNGEGCSNPVDETAEAWRKAGWVPGDGVKAKVTLPLDEKPKVARKPAMRQKELFTDKPASPPPLTDDDY